VSSEVNVRRRAGRGLKKCDVTWARCRQLRSYVDVLDRVQSLAPRVGAKPVT
jgi:hypothetical protein